MPLYGGFRPNRGSATMSSLRTVPAPSNVGANTAVLRGIGNRVNRSRGTPEIV
jgi:hypothetical protein